MNTPVSFEIAKLLKEKEFNENCSDYYTQTGNLNSDGWGDIIYEQGFGSGEPDRMLRFNYSDFNKNQKETCFLCPTIAEVVMWLYEKHGFWCYVYTNGKLWYPCIQYSSLGDMAVLSSKIGLFNSPTEAYEAVIKYTLKNLI
jgi:hypothetical protein